MSNRIATQSQIERLIARKQYSTAAKVLSEICQRQPRNVAMRQQLADVLILAGEESKSLKVLEDLVNDFARASLFARAIAVVKRMQQIDPSHRDLDSKLAVLVKNQQRLAAEGSDRAAKTAPAAKPAQPLIETPEPPLIEPLELPLIEPSEPPPIEPLELPLTAAPDISPPAAATPKPAAPRATAGRAVALPPQPPPPPAAVPAEDDHNQLILQNKIEEEEALHDNEGPIKVSGLKGSALFRGFNVEQLEAVISGLQLTAKQPGEIIVAEGEPGASLFLIASGSVRVYVRNAVGSQKQIRVLRQGDFFGEISLLRGTRRTATITAATSCELLQLDRSAVNSIADKYPKVWDIIEAFCTRRSGSAEELGARGLV